MKGTIFTAKRLLPLPNHWVEGGGLLVVNGRIEEILESPAAVRRVARELGLSVTDLGEGLVVPGTVCAHAHLELSALVGRVESGADMLPWIGRVIEERGKLEVGEAEASAIAGARALVESGTTLIGDIDSLGGEALPAEQPGVRRVAFRELLDGGDATRTAAVLETVSDPLPSSELRIEGVSPHAPHTVSQELLAEVSRLAGSRQLPVQVHWSETREEAEWLLTGGGPFAALLQDAPRMSGLDWLERAGLLQTALSLVHGNFPEPGEPARLRAAGVALVHCPGSHAFFERAPFPYALYRESGVTLALGTDSLASNRSLDMRREMRLFRESAPELSAREVWTMATQGGASALGRAGLAGELSPGACADFAVVAVEEAEPRAALDALTAAEPTVREVWIGGSRVAPDPSSDLPRTR